jgi:VWFA-related protein
MPKTIALLFLSLLLCAAAFPQEKAQKPGDDQPVRISTELIQVDVVVTDKNGRIVRGLTRDDFTLYDKGKKQEINFIDFVDAAAGRRTRDGAGQADQTVSPQGLSEADVRRIFAFVIDDLTIRYEDLSYLRQMLMNFVNNQMLANDLVAIVRTAGGKGLLQQFTNDKDLLRRAVDSFWFVNHPLRAFNNPQSPAVTQADLQPAGGGGAGGAGAVITGGMDTSGDFFDIDSPQDETSRSLRAQVSLGTASFIIEQLKQLPGRKSLVLISGGIQALSTRSTQSTGRTPGDTAPLNSEVGAVINSRVNTSAGDISYFLNYLSDKATRAGVAIHTLDIRGLQAYAGVPSFSDTEAKSALGPGGSGGFGRLPDESLIGGADTFDGHHGLRVLSGNTGGIAVLNKNDFNEALNKIVEISEAYYLLSYTPSDPKFDGDFRKLEIKVKGDYKVYSRRGYYARADKPVAAPVTKQEKVLAAIKSPLARRDIDLDAMVLYKAASPKEGAIDIHMAIDPRKIAFEEQGEKQQANLDVVGFVYDELGKLRGGFSETVGVSLSADDFKKATEAGFTYSANTTLPPGVYQMRLAVYDNKTQNLGTLSRYLEVPDLTRGRLNASSLLLGTVPPKEMQSTSLTPLSATRQVSRTKDLRYAVIIYNAKQKDGKPQVTTQLTVSQNGRQIFKEAEERVQAGQNSSGQLLKVGQLGLSGVKPGRYTLMLVITDPLADKKAQTITRTMEFVVVD